MSAFNLRKSGRDAFGVPPGSVGVQSVRHSRAASVVFQHFKFKGVGLSGDPGWRAGLAEVGELIMDISGVVARQKLHSHNPRAAGRVGEGDGVGHIVAHSQSGDFDGGAVVGVSADGSLQEVAGGDSVGGGALGVSGLEVVVDDISRLIFGELADGVGVVQLGGGEVVGLDDMLGSGADALQGVAEWNHHGEVGARHGGVGGDELTVRACGLQLGEKRVGGGQVRGDVAAGVDLGEGFGVESEGLGVFVRIREKSGAESGVVRLADGGGDHNVSGRRDSADSLPGICSDGDADFDMEGVVFILQGSRRDESGAESAAVDLAGGAAINESGSGGMLPDGAGAVSGESGFEPMESSGVCGVLGRAHRSGVSADIGEGESRLQRGEWLDSASGQVGGCDSVGVYKDFVVKIPGLNGGFAADGGVAFGDVEDDAREGVDIVDRVEDKGVHGEV